jgi:hypothetical protein
VTKYTLYLRRTLGLANTVEIDFGATVPDARFLLAATAAECVVLANGLRLFRFSGGGRAFALFTFTQHSLADRPAQVRLRCDPRQLEVRSKQGIRLWPEPETYHLPAAPPECYEPPLAVVTAGAGEIRVPVSAGLVYRLAKAPAYIFAPPGMSDSEFRGILTTAELVCA